jgi:hypothetical protein
MGLNKPGVVSGVARPNQTLGQNPTINVNNLQPPTVHRSNSLSSPQNLRPISTGAATLIKN